MSAGRTIRVGVVGTGVMGADHASMLDRHVVDAEVALLADPDVERAMRLADTIPGARVGNDARALIADPDVDAVLVASSDATHPDLVIAAVRAGKPVLCEKPLAPTLEESDRVIRAIGRDGAALLSLGFMRRFDPAHQDLKAAVATGECGTPLLVHCVSRGVAAGPGATDELSITGSAVHEFDTVPWLLDSPVTEVSWLAPRPSAAATGLHDPQLILLRTADGVLTTVEVFLNARYGYDIRCEVVGEHGTVALANPVRVVRTTEQRRSTGYPADWRPRFADAYRLELRAWVASVASGAPSPLATGHDGLVASAVADAVIASLRDGGGWVPVRVPQVPA